MRVLAIVPAYNEEKSIASVINELKCYNFIDILVINDGSKDDTLLVVRKLNVEVIDIKKNHGIGTAMKIGYQYAKDKGYDIAVQVDADGQHDVAKINDLIRMIQENHFDMVIGSRYITKTRYRATLLRYLGIKYFSLLIHVLYKTPIKDITSGYRAVNKRVINYFAKHYPSYYPEIPMLANLITLDYKICEVPVEMRKRQAGKSSISFFNAVYYVFKITCVCIKEQIKFKKINRNKNK